MKILIIGYGAMGQILEKYLIENNCEVVDILGKNKETTLNFNQQLDYDVLVDFSHPDNLDQILNYLIKTNKPGVICTTGFNKEQLNKIDKAAKIIPLLYSKNMSIGIAIMKKVIKDINKLFNYQFDIEIIETHHNKKLDAPSGTALSLAEALKSDKEYQILNRQHLLKRRDKNEIAIHAVRGGNVVGEHQVLFLGEDEVLEIRHSALSKKLFCQGTLTACLFIINQQPGLYSIENALNI